MNKNKERKIYVIGSTSYASWMQGSLVKKMEDADLVVGVGGPDWSPEFYYKGKNKKHPTVSSYKDLDEYEWSQFQKAIALKKKIIGICKSAQAGAILVGGALIQHQSSNGYHHYMNTYDGRKILVSSLHHEAQYLAESNLKEGEDYRILGWTENTLNFRYLDEKEQVKGSIELEDVFYPKINFLSVQSHPEMNFSSKDPELIESTLYYQELLDKFLTNQL